ncbi:hypothetical protein ASG68_01200 [Rhizobium sp. Leaf453]|nr:hypothetical protein [Rhizobium sp. Leaf453]KQU09655.1 hypothetical protein ASG68_01200 [Rhizobium sp. Leaf453]
MNNEGEGREQQKHDIHRQDVEIAGHEEQGDGLHAPQQWMLPELAHRAVPYCGLEDHKHQRRDHGHDGKQHQMREIEPERPPPWPLKLQPHIRSIIGERRRHTGQQHEDFGCIREAARLLERPRKGELGMADEDQEKRQAPEKVDPVFALPAHCHSLGPPRSRNPRQQQPA